jgi:hypothetical protein
VVGVDLVGGDHDDCGADRDAAVPSRAVDVVLTPELLQRIRIGVRPERAQSIAILCQLQRQLGITLVIIPTALTLGASRNVRIFETAHMRLVAPITIVKRLPGLQA